MDESLTRVSDAFRKTQTGILVQHRICAVKTLKGIGNASITD